MRECGSLVRNMGREGIDGKTRLSLKVNFGWTKDKEMEY